MNFSEILLLLFIINLGTTFGAGIYETRIVLPLWFTKMADGYRVNTQTMRDIDTGRKFWGTVTTVPLTLLTIANLVLAWQSQSPRHEWWLAAALISLLERIGTFSFFIPTAIRLQKAETLDAATINRLVPLWIRFNYVRNIFTLTAWILALMALSIPA